MPMHTEFFNFVSLLRLANFVSQGQKLKNNQTNKQINKQIKTEQNKTKQKKPWYVINKPYL